MVSCHDEECDGSVNNTELRPADRRSHGPENEGKNKHMDRGSLESMISLIYGITLYAHDNHLTLW